MRPRKCVAATVCATLLGGLFPLLPTLADAEQPAENQTASQRQWSATQAPVLYGMTETILKVGDPYAPTMAMYRIHARDIEDGDLSASVRTSGDTIPVDGALVSSEASGHSYTLTHTVTDSDGNTGTMTSTVRVLPADSTERRSVTRKVYNNASAWNTQLQGILRMDGHDRQAVGLSVPATGSVEAQVLTGDTPLRFTWPTNDTQTDGRTVTVNPGSSVTLSGPTNTPAPLTVYTPMNAREEGSRDKGITVRLTYGDDAYPTPYHYLGDDQDSFLAQWDTTHTDHQDPYALIEGSRSLSLVRNDLDKPNLFRLHPTVDSLLSYVDDVIERDDRLIGLDPRAADPLDQQVRSKEFFRANRHGAGSFYYGGDHVGANAANVASLFNDVWGLLHEIGHGYQGQLGRKPGAFDSGETSNNILAYYAQHNPDIVDVPASRQGYWWDRQSGELTLNRDYRLKPDTPDFTWNRALLNAYITMLDAVGQRPSYKDSAKDAAGREPFGQINHWYRVQRSQGRTLTNESAWLLALADCFSVDFSPFLQAWGVTIPEQTLTALGERPELDRMILLADALGVGKDGASTREALEKQVRDAIGTTYRFEAVRTSQLNSVLSDLGEPLEGTLNVNLTGTDHDTGVVHVVNNGTTVAILPVTDGTASARLTVGSYQIQAPYVEGYSQPATIDATIRADATSSISLDYRPVGVVASSGFTLLGAVHHTLALSARLNPSDGTLALSLGNADTGCAAYTGDGDCAGISVTDGTGTVKNTTVGAPARWRLPAGTRHFADIAGSNAKPTVPIVVGDRIRLRWYMWQRDDLTLFQDEDGTDQPANRMRAMEETYEVTSGGLVRIDMDAAQRDSMVTATAERWLDTARNTWDAARLANRRSDVNRRATTLAWYSLLPQDHRAPYADFIDSVEHGSKPTFIIGLSSVSLTQGQAFDPTAYDAKASDLEDGDLTGRIEISIPDDAAEPGTHAVTYTVTDSDGNSATTVLTLTVTQPTQPEQPTRPTDPDNGSGTDNGHGVHDGNAGSDGAATGTDNSGTSGTNVTGGTNHSNGTPTEQAAATAANQASISSAKTLARTGVAHPGMLAVIALMLTGAGIAPHIAFRSRQRPKTVTQD